MNTYPSSEGAGQGTAQQIVGHLLQALSYEAALIDLDGTMRQAVSAASGKKTIITKLPSIPTLWVSPPCLPFAVFPPFLFMILVSCLESVVKRSQSSTLSPQHSMNIRAHPTTRNIILHLCHPCSTTIIMGQLSYSSPDLPLA